MMRTYGWMSMLLVCLLWAAAGCTPTNQGNDNVGLTGMNPGGSNTAHIPEYAPADLNTILDDLLSNAGNWRTLMARCDVRVYSPRISNRGGGDRNTIQFRDGRLVIFKDVPVVEETPSMVKINLRVGDSFVLVSNGKEYYTSIPTLRQEYYGKVGQPPSSGRPRNELPVLPVRPQDVGEAMEPWSLFWNRLPVIKQDVGSLGSANPVVEVLSLQRDEPVESGRRGGLRVASNLLVTRETRRPTTLFKYGERNAARAVVYYREFHEHDYSEQSESGEGERVGDMSGRGGRRTGGPGSTPVTLPRKLRIGFPETNSWMEITLSEFRVNQPLPAGIFDLVETSPE